MDRRWWKHLKFLVRHFPTIDPNIRDHAGFTALARYASDTHVAADRTSITYCMNAFIVDLECDTSIGTNSGQTPLAFLISNGNEIGLRLLLESGKPLGNISVRDWIRNSDGQQLTAVSGLLSGYIQAQINHERQTTIGKYYYGHSLEQKNLNEIEAWYRNLTAGLMSGTNTTLSPMDDTSDDATPMDLETSINFVTRNQRLKEDVLEIRNYLSTVGPTVPEINTRVINDNLRTPIMYAVDEVLDRLPDHRGGKDTNTRYHIERVRFLLDVFPPKYTNVYIQDRDSGDLLQRLTELLRYERCLSKYERIDLIDDDHVELPSLTTVIKKYISASVIDHVPLTRDVTIAPMMGVVPCNASRFSAAFDEINIWVSGNLSCCISIDGFIRDDTDNSCPFYLPTDPRFCTLLQKRDGFSSTEPIRILLPSWWGVSDRRHVLYGVERVPESQSLMYQLIRLI